MFLFVYRDFGFQTFGAGSREEISRRFRILRPNIISLSSSIEKIGKRKTIQIHTNSIRIPLQVFTGTYRPFKGLVKGLIRLTRRLSCPRRVPRCSPYHPCQPQVLGHLLRVWGKTMKHNEEQGQARKKQRKANKTNGFIISYKFQRTKQRKTSNTMDKQ